jgi:hypothetical protein
MESPNELKAGSSRDERGKREKWVCGRWSRQMNFKVSSSRKREKERPLGGVARQAKGKALR